MPQNPSVERTDIALSRGPAAHLMSVRRHDYEHRKLREALR